MHDLDPQDQPQHRALSAPAEPPVEADFGEVGQGFDRLPGHLASREEQTDLSALDDDALATEAKREALRDQRQERHAREDRERQHARKAVFDNRERVTLLCLLVFAAAASMAVVISGFLESNDDIVNSGLLSLCAICGGMVYRLRLTAKQ